MRLRLLFPLVVALSSWGPGLFGAEDAPGDYSTVEVEAAKTSIYVGTVTLTLPEFTRRGLAYSGTYEARVFPYFFFSESGRISIVLPEDQLQRLARGDPVDFSGQAWNKDGDSRRIEGHAVPSGPESGSLKIRVFVTKRIQLIFKTTYHFGKG